MTSGLEITPSGFQNKPSMEKIDPISEQESVSAESLKSDRKHQDDTTDDCIEETKQNNYPPIKVIREEEIKNDKNKLVDNSSPLFDFHLLEVVGRGKISLIHKGVNLSNGQTITIKYMEDKQPSCLESLMETVENLRSKINRYDRFIKYFRADYDSQYKLLMLITEYTELGTLKEYIEQYGFLDESISVKIIADIVISLRQLEKAKSFHGRLKLNNIHIDKSFKVKLNDYGIYNDIYRGNRKNRSKQDSGSSNLNTDSFNESESANERSPKMSFVEGIRVDIYFLGIIILKMMGKMRIEEGDNSNMTSLLQIADISVFYKNESLSEEMISFLDICFNVPHITLSEIMLHELVVEIVTRSESIKTFPESPNMTFNDSSSK